MSLRRSRKLNELRRLARLLEQAIHETRQMKEAADLERVRQGTEGQPEVEVGFYGGPDGSPAARVSGAGSRVGAPMSARARSFASVARSVWGLPGAHRRPDEG